MANVDRSPRRYVERGVPRSVPVGELLVRNPVRHEPDMPVGVNGFRAETPPAEWQAVPLVECECGWAPLAGIHYRVDLDHEREAEDREREYFNRRGRWPD